MGNVVKSTPGGTRTPDARLRTPPLYPLSYRGKLVEIGDSNPQPRHCERRALPFELYPLDRALRKPHRSPGLALDLG